MSYRKQNFKDGSVLNASQLNHMEDGIAQVTQTVENLDIPEAPDLSGFVQFKSQTLTDTQKTQARNNIGAVGADYIVGIFEELKALIQAGSTEEAVAVLDQAILDMTTLA